MSEQPRTFTDTEAKREHTPLIVGLVGPTGAGKTGSALELATGFQDVQGGEIGFIDSEARRALAYADAPMFSDPKRRFKFRHLDFKPPFSPRDYKAAALHFIAKGVKHIIIDSTTHMWEGEGGIHEMHDAEVDRLARAWNANASTVNFPAWAEPKRQQTEFINWMKQQPINWIFCFRAKEKLKMVNKKPVDVGWQAVGGDELLYEMTLACLLLPQCDGQPIWNREEEKGVKALAQHFRPMFAQNPRLSAAVGRQLATWSKGEDSSSGSTTITATTTTKREAPKLTVVGEAVYKAMLDVTKGLPEADAKKKWADVTEKYFGTRKWTEVTAKADGELETGLLNLKTQEGLL